MCINRLTVIFACCLMLVPAIAIRSRAEDNEILDDFNEQLEKSEDPVDPDTPVIINDNYYWQEVSNTMIYPFNNIVYIKSTFHENGVLKSYRGSGVIISEDLVLTAGHNIYNVSRGGFAVSTEIYRAKYVDSNGNEQNPYGSVSTIEYHLYQNYSATTDTDLAVLRVDHPICAFETGLAPAGFEVEDGAGAMVIGYPSDSDMHNYIYGPYMQPGRRMYQHGKIINYKNKGLAYYQMDTLKGSSGSPVLDAEKKIIAIHVGGSTTTQYNYGVLINNVKTGWINQERTAKTSVYKMHNSNNNHLYTSSADVEYIISTVYGWTYEKVAWISPTSGASVYEIAKGEKKAYTTSVGVVGYATTIGWTNNGEVFKSGGSVPVYSLRSVDANGEDEFYYTSDVNEKNYLVNAYGLVDEGIAFYCMRNGDY